MSRLGRRLAFDFGDTRIGVAVCDLDGILSSPLDALQAKHPKLRDQLIDLIREIEPVKIYVGLPLHLSGEESESSVKAREFAEKIKELSSCEIEFVDERLTTASASAQLQQAGISAKAQRSIIDSQSAVMILEMGLAKDRAK